MTDRIYYTDARQLAFEAIVTGADRLGDRPAVTLDRTAFYPASGGQPHDTGVLAEARVVEVLEDEAGAIRHVLDRDLPVGARVNGRVDRDRRFDHMQQHTGQHVLSAAFDRLSSARTVGFHLGAELTVDLAIPVAAEAIAAAEAEANRIVWENRPVVVRFVSDAEAASLPLRKETERTGTLRVIEIEGYDLSACGGTHVSRTGEVGVIAVLSSERLRGGTRIQFVCGGRALRTLHRLGEAVAGCIRHVSVAPEELPAALERLQADSREQKKIVTMLQERLAGYEAGNLAGRATLVGGVGHVVETVEGHDQAGLKAMALAICARGTYAVALFSASPPHLAVLARSAGARVDCRAALGALHARFGGRGGGKADLAQGGGLAGSLAEILEFTRVTFEQA